MPRIKSSPDLFPNIMQLQRDAEMYRKVNPFLQELRAQAQENRLTIQQFRTLRGQAISGDLEGARRGLWKILNRK